MVECINITNIYAKGGENVQVVVEDGIKYKITTKSTLNGNRVVLEYEDNKIEYTKTDETVSVTSYEYQGENFFGGKKYRKVNQKTEKINDYINKENKDVYAQYTWNSKTETPSDWGSQYWYQYGVSSYNNAYLQIGCKAKYRIKYYNISEKKQSKCDELTAEIKNCCQKWDLASASLGGTTMAIAVAAIIASVATIEIPVVAIVSAIVAVVGGYAAGITNLVLSYYSYLNVKDLYTIVKTYGSKV